MSNFEPYFAVIFSSQRSTVERGYAEAAQRMLELAAEQPGYLGVESARGGDGFGITVSYWTSLEAIAAWKAVAEHREVQRTGRSEWYAHYRVRIVRVEREYAFEAAAPDPA
ncbi:antibiotic biosynthesis monooxygenase family protein [Aquimonas sp.]|jgi:heme-degrading monooxygenase HmoA|uniref:antibiotic biosynthesis monooxygenase family protein n=1 Tax=Aquimonas sp. TaxID=1872588 RepID=UPI0037C095AD